MAIHIKPSHKGLLHKDLHVKQGEHIPEAKLEKAEHSKNKAVKKRAVFAENAKHFDHSGPKHASQPHPKTNPGFYDTEPHAPSNKKATRPSLPSPALGRAVPPTVPQHPGRISGLGGPAHVMARSVGGSHGYGHSVINRLGGLRLSGHVSAHRLGKR